MLPVFFFPARQTHLLVCIPFHARRFAGHDWKDHAYLYTCICTGMALWESVPRIVHPEVPYFVCLWPRGLLFDRCFSFFLPRPPELTMHIYGVGVILCDGRRGNR